MICLGSWPVSTMKATSVQGRSNGRSKGVRVASGLAQDVAGLSVRLGQGGLQASLSRRDETDPVSDERCVAFMRGCWTWKEFNSVEQIV